MIFCDVRHKNKGCSHSPLSLKTQFFQKDYNILSLIDTDKIAMLLEWEVCPSESVTNSFNNVETSAACYQRACIWTLNNLTIKITNVSFDICLVFNSAWILVNTSNTICLVMTALQWIVMQCLLALISCLNNWLYNSTLKEACQA